VMTVVIQLLDDTLIWLQQVVVVSRVRPRPAIG
jgi:hypothetical protein